MSGNVGTVNIEIKVSDKGAVVLRQIGEVGQKAGAQGKQSFTGFSKSVEDNERQVVLLHKALYALNGVVAGLSIGSFFSTGLKAVEDYTVKVAALTAFISTFSKTVAQGDMAGGFREANEYAQRLIPALEMIDNKSIASGKDLNVMAETMIQNGVLLDIDNKKQVQGFLNISNALALVTAGQDKDIQFRQEINSLLQGQIRATDRLPRLLANIDPQLESHLRIWKEEGTTVEHVGALLAGFGASAGLIENTWAAVGSSLQTVRDRVLRDGFRPVYEDLLNIANQIRSSLVDTEGHLTPLAQKLQSEMAVAYDDVKVSITAIKSIYDVLPDWMVGAGGIGLVGGIMFGAKGAAVIATSAIIGDYVKDMSRLAGLASAGAVKWDDVFQSGHDSRKQMLADFEAQERATTPTSKHLVPPATAPALVKGVDPKAIEEAKKAAQALLALARHTNEQRAAIEAAGITQREQMALAELANENTLLDAQFAARLISEEEYYNSSNALQQSALETKYNALTEQYRAAGQRLAEAQALLDQHHGDKKELGLIQDVDKAQAELVKLDGELQVLALQFPLLRDFLNAKGVERKNGLNDFLQEAGKASLDAAASIKVMYETAGQYSGDVDLAKQISDIRRASEERIAQLKSHPTATSSFEIAFEPQNVQNLIKAAQDYHDAAEVLRAANEVFNSASFGNEFADSINGATSAMGQLIATLKEHASLTESIARQREEAEKLTDPAEKAARMETLYKAEAEGQLRTVAGYRAMAGAAEEMFKKNSKEREAMHKVEQVLGAIELAMQIKKIAVEVAGYATTAGAAIASGAAVVAANTAAATSGAVAAITTQGEGDPYSAFARIAAMIALMGGVLAMGGMAFSGGSPAGYTNTTQPDTGTVFGDKDATSTSLADSMAMLEDNHAEDYAQLRGINQGVHDLNSSILGLVNNLVTNAGTYNAAQGISLAGTNSGAGIFSKDDMANKIISGSWIGDYLGDSKLSQFIVGFTTGVTSGLFSAIGKVFGGGQDISLQGQGINLSDITIGATRTRDMIVQSYTDVLTEEDGGWFGSDSSWVDRYTSAVDASTSRLFNQVIDNLSTSITEIGKFFGTSADLINNYVYDLGDINLQGLDGAGVNKKLNEYFSAISDRAVQTLFGDKLATYQKVGEGSLQTITRLMIDQASVMDILDTTGQRLRGDLLATSEAMLTMAGGLDKLQESASTYYDKFFSDAEKQADLQARLKSVFADIEGTTAAKAVLPGTREAYRAIVEGLNLTTAAGQESYVTLLRLAGAADQYYGYLENAAKDATAAAKDVAAAQEEAAKQAKAAHDAATSTAEQNLRQAFQTEQAGFQKTIDQFGAFSASLRDFRQGLTLGTAAGLSPEAAYQQASTQFADISRRARLNDVEALGQFQDVARNFVTASEGYNAHSAAFFTDQAAVLQATDQIIAGTDRQQDNATRQLEALTMQVSALVTINDSVLSVAAAIEALRAVDPSRFAAPPSGNVYSVDNTMVPQVLTAPPPEVMPDWMKGATTPTELAFVSRWAKDHHIPGYANGGYPDGGMIMAGEAGRELIPLPGRSRVFNNADTEKILSGKSTEKTEALLVEVRDALRALFSQQSAIAPATLAGLDKLADKIDTQTRKLERAA